MYKILDCRTYQFVFYTDHVAYGIALKQNYDYCKTINWNDHESTLQLHVSELPYYHPYWHRKVVEDMISQIPHVEKEIEALKVYKGQYSYNAVGRLDQLRLRLNELIQLRNQII